MRLKDRVAVITGGASGIGRATALLFAEEGAKVVIGDVDIENGEKTVQEINEKGFQAQFVLTNVAKAQDVQRLIQTAADSFGTVDILVNNAGVGHREALSFELTEEEWDSIIDINLKGVFLGLKYAAPIMMERGKGAIVNTSSLLGLKGMKYQAGYNSSKGGVVLLTKNAALEYGKYGIRVNAIAPGVIDTNIISGWKENDFKWPIISKANALRRIGQPEEVARAILFLASDEASFITGAILSVDGGGSTY